jgi:cytochrome c-type biogenesis protein CcmH
MMTRLAARLALLIALGLAPQIALAVQPDEIMTDTKLEARARVLSQQLRCMVCQNQSIDDSDAPLARDLRLLVRERIAHGDTNAQVIDFLVARYGPFVLLKPPFSRHTLMLWLLPPLTLAAGAIALVLYARRRAVPGIAASQNGAVPLSAEEEAELARLTGNQKSGNAA